MLRFSANLSFLFLDRPFLERFEAVYAQYLDEIDRFCTSKQVPYIRADVNVPFDELILRVFRRGGFLR